MVKQRITDPEAFLKEVYRLAISDRIKYYNTIAKLLRRRIKVYKMRARAPRLSLYTSKSFETKWVKKDVPSLDYILVEGQLGESAVLQSCVPIYSYENRDFIWNLCHHYDCEVQQLADHIAE